MRDLKEINGIFNDCYKLYKKYAAMEPEPIVPVLEALTLEADELCKKHKCKLATEVIVAVINELDRVYTEKRKA